MSTTTEAPAAPDLSSLDKRLQLNVKVAETQGWFWEREDEEPENTLRWFVPPPDLADECMYAIQANVETGTFEVNEHLPDYAGDPAAWGALMEKELDGWERAEGIAHRCWWRHAEGFRVHGPYADGAGVSVCAAVLAKAGVDPTPYID